MAKQHCLYATLSQFAPPHMRQALAGLRGLVSACMLLSAHNTMDQRPIFQSQFNISILS